MHSKPMYSCVSRHTPMYTLLCAPSLRTHTLTHTPQEMREVGVAPNVVCYNTLIDVYGKTGQWAEALRTLARMRSEVGRSVPERASR